MQDKTKSIDTIFFMKGIAIILVVIGHYFPHDSPNYWGLLRDFVYLFHMPTFFAISGFLFYKSSDKNRDARTLLLSKAKRLGIPYISIALLFFIIKYFSQFVLILDHPVNLTSFFSVFLSPIKSYMPLLWFMYSLFTMMVALKLFEILISPTVLFVSAVILYVTIPNAGELFSIGATLRNFPFFLAGYISYAYIMDNDTIEHNNLPWLVSLFLLVLVFSAQKKFNNHLNIYSSAALKLILGFLGIYFVAMISASPLVQKRILHLKTIGIYSMSIYLFHTFFESAIRYIVHAPTVLPLIPFILGAILAITVGISFPLFLEKYLLRKFSATRKLFLGQK